MELPYRLAWHLRKGIVHNTRIAFVHSLYQDQSVHLSILCCVRKQTIQLPTLISALLLKRGPWSCA